MDEAERAFFQTIEARITALRGKGYALSAIDAHRVAQWWQRGAPLATALLAVEQAAAEAARRGRLERLSLAGVEARLEALLARRASGGLEGGEGAEPAGLGAARPWARLRALVEDVGQRLEDGPVRAQWRQLWRELVAASEADGDPWSFAAAMDARLVDTLAGEVPEAVIGEALAAIRSGPGYASSSPRAREEAELLAKGEAIRSYLGLPELLEALLYP